MQNLSLRKYAKTIGVSHWTVGKAIKAGHIKRGYNKKTKKINPKIADKEWGNEAREKHKCKLLMDEPEGTPQQAPLITAFTNCYNACDPLLNAINDVLTILSTPPEIKK